MFIPTEVIVGGRSTGTISTLRAIGLGMIESIPTEGRLFARFCSISPTEGTVCACCTRFICSVFSTLVVIWLSMILSIPTHRFLSRAKSRFISTGAAIIVHAFSSFSTVPTVIG